MSLIAKSSGEKIPPIGEGTYQAICTVIIDLGLQRSEKFEKTYPKIMIMWSFPTETITVKEEELPRVISKEYTNSLGEKSNLTRDLQAWRGKNFTQEELSGFNLINVLNIPCLMQIIYDERNGNIYPKISSIMALPKDMQKSEKELQNIVFDFDTKETWNNYHNIPIWIQNKIKTATNYETSGLKEFVEKYENMVKENNDSNDGVIAPDDDLPF